MGAGASLPSEDKLRRAILVKAYANDTIRDADDPFAQQLQGHFESVDANGDGKLSLTEFQEALSRMQLHCNERKLTELFNKFDHRRTGRIVSDEVLAFLFPQAKLRSLLLSKSAPVDLLHELSDPTLLPADVMQEWSVQSWMDDWGGINSVFSALLMPTGPKSAAEQGATGVLAANQFQAIKDMTEEEVTRRVFEGKDATLARVVQVILVKQRALAKQQPIVSTNTAVLRRRLADKTAVEIASLVRAFGNNYEPYSKLIVGDGVNGATVLEMGTEDLLNALHVTHQVHVSKLSCLNSRFSALAPPLFHLPLFHLPLFPRFRVILMPFPSLLPNRSTGCDFVASLN
jgi:hypothetical protein